MDTKFMKNVSQKKQVKENDPHISGVAATLLGIIVAATVIGVIFMDGRVGDGWIGLFVSLMTLVGVYILFALKVASQWEKAVVLRLGKFHA
ncbi:MAG: hypothetical protein M3R47_17860, partial [Chloroflexota bacterium]|nr:hypothetical protein [Chloroflexota bacterium]